MQSITIAKAGNFELVSHGNGIAYTLKRHDAMGREYHAYVQGDDATAFRAEYEAHCERDNGEYPIGEALREMWHTYC